MVQTTGNTEPVTVGLPAGALRALLVAITALLAAVATTGAATGENEPSPRARRAAALEALVDLLPTGEDNVDLAIAQARDALGPDIDEFFWLDDYHLRSSGSRYFTHEGRSLASLFAARIEPELSEEVKDGLTGPLGEIVRANLDMTALFIEEALGHMDETVCTPEGKKVKSWCEKVERALVKGRKHLDKAEASYSQRQFTSALLTTGSAWVTAFKPKITNDALIGHGEQVERAIVEGEARMAAVGCSPDGTDDDCRESGGNLAHAKVLLAEARANPDEHGKPNAATLVKAYKCAIKIVRELPLRVEPADPNETGASEEGGPGTGS